MQSLSYMLHKRAWGVVLLFQTLCVLAPLRGASLPDILPASAQTAGTDQAFQLALPGYTYHFPRDHGSHDAYRTEWWYFTGHLISSDDRRFGYELTFFRRGVTQDPKRPKRSEWAIRHLYLAHFALTDIDGGAFHYTEKISRAGLGKAGAETGRLKVWIDRWFAKTDSLDQDRLRIKASTDGFAIDLLLTPAKQPVIHGQSGVSRKGEQPGQASHYYSFSRLVTEGTVMLSGRDLPVTGLSWMDHEFGSAELGSELVGWDWFSVQLKDQTELMVYVLRRTDGTAALASSGTFVSADGRARHLTKADVVIEIRDHWMSEQSGARYPSRWHITVPRLDLSLTIVPLLAEQELITRKSTQVTYWEGAVNVQGTKAGAPVSGHGFVELTGYAEPFGSRL